MSEALDLLRLLSNFTPVGVMALLGFVIVLLVKQQRGHIQLRENDLHELSESLRRIELVLTEIWRDLVYIKARVNGR